MLNKLAQIVGTLYWLSLSLSVADRWFPFGRRPSFRLRDSWLKRISVFFVPSVFRKR